VRPGDIETTGEPNVGVEAEVEGDGDVDFVRPGDIETTGEPNAGVEADADADLMESCATARTVFAIAFVFLVCVRAFAVVAVAFAAVSTTIGLDDANISYSGDGEFRPWVVDGAIFVFALQITFNTLMAFLIEIRFKG